MPGYRKLSQPPAADVDGYIAVAGPRAYGEPARAEVGKSSPRGRLRTGAGRGAHRIYCGAAAGLPTLRDDLGRLPIPHGDMMPMHQRRRLQPAQRMTPSRPRYLRSLSEYHADHVPLQQQARIDMQDLLDVMIQQIRGSQSAQF